MALVFNVQINLSRNVDLLISASQRTGGNDVPSFSLSCSRLGSDVSADATISLTRAIDCLKPPTSEGCPEKQHTFFRVHNLHVKAPCLITVPYQN